VGAREGAQGVKRVVRQETAPHKAPNRIDGLGRVSSANGFMQWTEKRGASRPQILEDPGFTIG
jgi:hypothetical protein